MNKKIMKTIIGVVTAVTVAGSFVGCGNKNSNVSETTSPNSGEIMVLGSSALQPLAEVAAKDFMDKNKEAVINVQGGGSGAGIKGVLEGSAEWNT